MPTLPTHRRLSWEGNHKKVKNPVHHTNRWKLASVAKRIKDPLCQVCKAIGIVTPATEVDHIIPISQGGTNDDNNLQSICNACHRNKTKAENRRRVGG